MFMGPSLSMNLTWAGTKWAHIEQKTEVVEGGEEGEEAEELIMAAMLVFVVLDFFVS